MKKLTCMLLAMVMVLGLVACGGSSNSDEASEPTAEPAVEATEAPETEPAEEAEPADEGEAEAVDTSVPVKVGGIGPLTGDVAIYGLATYYGAQIAVDEINAMGGLQMELNFQDDEGDAEKAVNAYNTLKDWGMQMVYGTTTTAPCIAVSAETNADRYFQLTPSASSTQVTEGKDNVFQMCFTDPNQGVTAADYIHENELGTKIAVLYDNSDAYSSGIAQAFIDEAGKVGLEVVSTQTFISGDNDFSVQLNDAKSNEADLVFMPFYYNDAALVLAQASAMEYAPKWFGADGMDGLLTLEGFDTSLAEGLMLMTPFDATSEVSASFVSKYEDAHGETPNQFAADGYDCMYAIYNACVKAGVTGETPADEVCEKMVSTFTSDDFSVDGLTGTGITWSANGEVSKAPIVVAIHDGAYVTM